MSAHGRLAEVRVFAPATVSNLGCGFDVFGLALRGPGDEVTVRRAGDRDELALRVAGDGGRVPTDPARNSAAVAARAVRERLGVRHGLALTVRKGLPVASGLGGSAASAVAGAVASHVLLGGGLDESALLECALAGERLGSGAGHPDNAAPALAGGIVLAAPGDPVRIVRLPAPDDLVVAVVRPRMEVETARARAILNDSVPLAAAVRQWGSTAGLVAALYEEDWELLARSVHDAVAEPVRAPLVPGFEAVKARALEAGAAGAGLSGSGPSVFALCRGRSVAERVARSMADGFREEADADSDLIVSAVGQAGARVLEAAR